MTRTKEITIKVVEIGFQTISNNLDFYRKSFGIFFTGLRFVVR
jgi:hypothetical protein